MRNEARKLTALPHTIQERDLQMMTSMVVGDRPTSMNFEESKLSDPTQNGV
jgi:hypothetical protein